MSRNLPPFRNAPNSNNSTNVPVKSPLGVGIQTAECSFNNRSATTPRRTCSGAEAGSRGAPFADIRGLPESGRFSTAA
jgi:hypothetical protein